MTWVDNVDQQLVRSVRCSCALDRALALRRTWRERCTSSTATMDLGYQRKQLCKTRNRPFLDLDLHVDLAAFGPAGRSWSR
jgi:hypothetical protein